MKQKIQRCMKCDDPTGKCEEDSLFVGEFGPLCEECFDQVEVEQPNAHVAEPFRSILNSFAAVPRGGR